MAKKLGAKHFVAKIFPEIVIYIDFSIFKRIFVIHVIHSHDKNQICLKEMTKCLTKYDGRREANIVIISNNKINQ